MTGLQPYVLRSWEKEFSGIGVRKSQDSTRLYRQSDVDHVVRIKQLMFEEGLTLAGARRRLDEGAPAARAAAEMAEVLDTLGADARTRIAVVRTGLRSMLEALSKAPGSVKIAELDIGIGVGDGMYSSSLPGARKVGPARTRRGSRTSSSSRRRSAARPAGGRRAKPAGPKRKASIAAKWTASTKRAVVARKPTRGAKRKHKKPASKLRPRASG